MRKFVFVAILAVSLTGCAGGAGGPDVLVDPDTGEKAPPVIEVLLDVLGAGAPAAGATGGATLPALAVGTLLAALVAYRKRKVIMAKITARREARLAAKE